MRRSSVDPEGAHPPAAEEAGVGEEGSAVVEFVFLAVLLLVPVVYLILVVAQLQGGAYAAAGAADQAAKVFVASDPADAEAQAARAVALTAADFGFEARAATTQISCDPADCGAAGSAVTVTVRLAVPLPLLPSVPGLQLSASTVEASATQLQGRFR
ncbi:hypothetical protein [Paenarthrobacter sp. DKR-5]|uniref:hypothetical protein n=1 Tax=Paenarthrobacter sp. DKR-5 TaxID=2835535 RepID=UPI0020292024|nr:hypothetical protein [Paenarthrobacter sp. DKR-5]